MKTVQHFCEHVSPCVWTCVVLCVNMRCLVCEHVPSCVWMCAIFCVWMCAILYVHMCCLVCGCVPSCVWTCIIFCVKCVSLCVDVCHLVCEHASSSVWSVLSCVWMCHLVTSLCLVLLFLLISFQCTGRQEFIFLTVWWIFRWNGTLIQTVVLLKCLSYVMESLVSGFVFPCLFYPSLWVPVTCSIWGFALNS